MTQISSQLDGPLPKPQAIEDSLRGRLARGFKPSTVDVDVPWRQENMLAIEQRVLSLFRAVAAARSVTLVRLGEHMPLTHDVVQAIAAVSPKLSGLHITTGCSITTSSPPQPLTLASEPAAAAAGLLLQLLGLAGLRELRLLPSDLLRSWPVTALDSLSYCTALTKLELSCNMVAIPQQDALPAESSLLRNLSSLTRLRDLSLDGGAWPPLDYAVRQARAASLESCLSPLAALTRLDVRLRCLQHFPLRTHPGVGGLTLPDQVRALREEGRPEAAAQLLSAAEAEWCAVAEAARRMPALRELCVPVQADAADLASLTTLTSLQLGAIVWPAAAQEAAVAAAAQQQGAAEPWKAPVYDLPPLLQRLESRAPLSVHVAASLRPAAADAVAAAAAAAAAAAPGGAPPRRVALAAGGADWGWGQVQLSLALSPSDLDRKGRLTAGACAALQTVLAALNGPFRLAPLPQSPEPGLRVAVSRAVAPPPPAAAGDAAAAAAAAAHSGSWLGDLAALRLGSLALSGLALSSRDVLSLTRRLTGLKSLDLRGCRYIVDVLPLLAGLPSLEALHLGCNDWQWPADVPQAGSVEATFLGLTASPDGPAEAKVAAAASGASAGPAARLPLPRLLELCVQAVGPALGGEEEVDWDWLQAALAPASAELARRRPAGAVLSVRVHGAGLAE